MYDYIVVGCGFSGATIARVLAEAGKKVCIIEKRSHIAGNMYDELSKEGILVQKYGPHIFHTNNKKVMDFLRKYGDWTDFQLKGKVYMNQKFTPSPFNLQTIDDYYEINKAIELKHELKKVYKDLDKTTIVEMLENKNSLIREYAEFLYQNDYSLYTAKQWGISPEEVDVNVLKRVPVLLSYEVGYFQDKYQCMPSAGFTDFFKKLIQHKNIELKLNLDFKNYMQANINLIDMINGVFKVPVIYTGPLDNLLEYCYGVLPYRTLKFEYEEIGVDSYQDAPVVAYPQEEGFTRITEFKKLTNQNIYGKTIIAKEYPMQYQEIDKVENEPYYPIHNRDNLSQYLLYKEEIDKIKNIYLCGRLAEYKYYNMDQVIENALNLADKLIKGD